MTRTTMIALGISALAASGCMSSPAPDPAGPRIQLTVSPLSLPGAADVCYGIYVQNGSGDLVAYVPHICSSQYGNGVGGDISYVVPCDAQALPTAANAQNKVTLVLEGIDLAAGSITSWLDETQYRNPCGWPDANDSGQALATDGALNLPIDTASYTGPGNGPEVNWDGFTCQRTVACEDNADSPVTFNLTVMRDADQGFFDIAVNFEDIFCSAKLDCLAAGLIADVDGERGPTVVLGLACTGGPGAIGTTLLFDDIAMTCAATAASTTIVTQPTQDGNQLTPVDAQGTTVSVYQVGIYQGDEELACGADASGPISCQKVYSNTAIGVGAAALGSTCTLTTQATAGSRAFGPTTPANTSYPLIDVDVQITNGTGSLVCGANPLNGGVRPSTGVPGTGCYANPPTGVCTSYTGVAEPTGTTFLHSFPTLPCGPMTNCDPGDLCPDDDDKREPGSCGCGWLETNPCSRGVTVDIYDTTGNPVTTFVYDDAGHTTGAALVYVDHPQFGASGFVPAPYQTTFLVGTTTVTFYARYLGTQKSFTVSVSLLGSSSMATIDFTTGTVTYGPSPTASARVRFVVQHQPVTVELYETTGNPATSFAYDDAAQMSGAGLVYVDHPLGASGWVPHPFGTNFALGTTTVTFYARYLGTWKSFGVNVSLLGSSSMATIDFTTGTVTYGQSPTAGARVRFIAERQPVAVDLYETTGDPATSIVYDDAAHISGAGLVYIDHPMGASGWVPHPFGTNFALGTTTVTFYARYLGIRKPFSVNVSLLGSSSMATIDFATGGVTYGLSPTGDARVRFVGERMPVTVDLYNAAGFPVTGQVYVEHPLGASGFYASPFGTTFAVGTTQVTFYANYSGTEKAINVDVNLLGSSTMATIDFATGAMTYGASPTPGEFVRFVVP